MIRPWLAKYIKLPTNVENGQNDTYDNNFDDFTLYLSEFSSHQIKSIKAINDIHTSYLVLE